jgi:hypothetical protein
MPVLSVPDSIAVTNAFAIAVTNPGGNTSSDNHVKLFPDDTSAGSREG